MVVGENGVLNRATNAAEETSNAEMKQALEMAIDGAQGEFINIWTKDQSKYIFDSLSTTASDATHVKLSAEGGYTITLGTIPTENKGSRTTTITITKGSASKTATLTETSNGVGLSLVWNS